MSPEQQAASMIEIVDGVSPGHSSMRIKGQSNLLWHSADDQLMVDRQREMIKSLADAIRLGILSVPLPPLPKDSDCIITLRTKTLPLRGEDYKCANCKRQFVLGVHPSYCPCCGAHFIQFRYSKKILRMEREAAARSVEQANANELTSVATPVLSNTIWGGS